MSTCIKSNSDLIKFVLQVKDKIVLTNDKYHMVY
jgi:hypothetical protein